MVSVVITLLPQPVLQNKTLSATAQGIFLTSDSEVRLQMMSNTYIILALLQSS